MTNKRILLAVVTVWPNQNPEPGLVLPLESPNLKGRGFLFDTPPDPCRLSVLSGDTLRDCSLKNQQGCPRCNETNRHENNLTPLRCYSTGAGVSF